MLGAIGAVYFGVIPVTSYFTQPGGAFESVLNAFIRVLLPSSDKMPADRVIPALAAVYSFFTFVGTGAFSVAGLNASSERGLDKNSKHY